MYRDQRRIVLAGGAGFLGRLLIPWLQNRDWDVVVLTRRPGAVKHAAREAAWDGRRLGDWRRALEGAQAVVNLAGRSVNCRYHARNRHDILRSRVDSTRALGEAIAGCKTPPSVWLNSSTATIYRHALDRPMDEATGEIAATPAAHDAFSIEVAQAWEREFSAAQVPGTRKAALRTAMVFAAQPGTVFAILRRLARFGLGGAMAGGGQFVSWIHEVDFCRAIEWLLEDERLSGPVNVAAPYPVTNRQMMRIIRQACRRPFGLPATRVMLEIGALLLRTETELVIKSRRVVPGRLLESGFEFRFPRLGAAVEDLQPRFSQVRPPAAERAPLRQPTMVERSSRRV